MVEHRKQNGNKMAVEGKRYQLGPLEYMVVNDMLQENEARDFWLKMLPEEYVDNTYFWEPTFKSQSIDTGERPDYV